jgi:hypothetical protein
MWPNAAEPDELAVVGKPIRTDYRGPASRLCVHRRLLLASAVEEETQE